MNFPRKSRPIRRCAEPFDPSLRINSAEVTGFKPIFLIIARFVDRALHDFKCFGRAIGNLTILISYIRSVSTTE
jgi:hypothetical protein